MGVGKLEIHQAPSYLVCPRPASKVNAMVVRCPMETNPFTSLQESEPQSDHETLRVTSLPGGWTQKGHTHQSHAKLFPAGPGQCGWMLTKLFMFS